MFYLNITCGLALIHCEGEIYEILGLASFAGVLCTVTGFFNAAGRLGYSAVGDRLKDRNTVYKIILLSELLLTVLGLITGAIQNETAWICIILLIVVNLGYGGGFSNLPTLLSDVYGMEKISSIHGIALSAWAMAGLTGNQVASLIVKNSATPILGYQNILYFTLALYAVAFIIDFLLIRNKPNTKEESV